MLADIDARCGGCGLLSLLTSLSLGLATSLYLVLYTLSSAVYLSRAPHTQFSNTHILYYDVCITRMILAHTPMNTPTLSLVF